MTDGLIMKYFVLKPNGTTPYARASRAAMRHYARMICNTNPELAASLRRWADSEQSVEIDVQEQISEEPAP